MTNEQLFNECFRLLQCELKPIQAALAALQSEIRELKDKEAKRQESAAERPPEPHTTDWPPYLHGGSAF